WNISDSWHMEGDVQYSKASTGIIDLTMGPAAGPQFQNAGPYTLDLHGSGTPTIVIPANDILTNPDTIYHNFAMDHHEDNDADAWRTARTRTTPSTTATGSTRSALECATRTTTRPRARPAIAGARSARTGPADRRCSVSRACPSYSRTTATGITADTRRAA